MKKKLQGYFESISWFSIWIENYFGDWNNKKNVSIKCILIYVHNIHMYTIIERE